MKIGYINKQIKMLPNLSYQDVSFYPLQIFQNITPRGDFNKKLSKPNFFPLPPIKTLIVLIIRDG